MTRRDLRLVPPGQRAGGLAAEPLGHALAAQAEVEPPVGTDYTRPSWGHWSVCSHANVVRHAEPTWYEIDLDRIVGVNSAWAWMDHIDGKTWVGTATVGGLFRVINDILANDDWLNKRSSKDDRIRALRRYERRAEMSRLPCPLTSGRQAE